jgi:hypothetical protein
MGDPILVPTAIEGILAAGPAFEHLQLPMSPIQLTPHASYRMGRAALAFASPHVLIPADDAAEFGEGFLEEYSGWLHHEPHPGARVVVWFKPPESGREYNIDFSCEGQTGRSLRLESNKGTSEIANVDGEVDIGLRRTAFGTNFVPADRSWISFTLSSDGHWKFLSVEIRQLEA